MRRALPDDGMAPDPTGCGLGRAHHYHMTSHYRTPGTKTEAPPHVDGTPLPQARPRGTQTKSPPGKIIGSPESIESLRIDTKRQVGSEGTPHVGHADSITNDEHGSRSDIPD